MPSATKYKPRSARTQYASSLPSRRIPGWVATAVVIVINVRASPARARLARDLQPRQGAQHGDARALGVEIRLRRLAQTLFGAALGRFGARDVDIFGALGHIGEHAHTVGRDFGETARDERVRLVVALAEPDGP